MQNLVQLDQTVTSLFASLIAQQPFVAFLFKVIAIGLVYIVPILLLIVWFGYSRKNALRAGITGVLAWFGLNKLISHLIDRPRPTFSLIGEKELIFQRSAYSFPSDHSAFLMALTLSFYFAGQRKLGNFLLLITILVGITRVGIGVHFVGDILAGWMVGAVVALLIRAIDRLLDGYVLEPIIQLARRFRL